MGPTPGGYQETADIPDGPDVLDGGDVVEGIGAGGLATGSSGCVGYMLYSKWTVQAQRILGAHAGVSNLFNPGRHLVGAEHYRNPRMSAFAEWEKAVA